MGRPQAIGSLFAAVLVKASGADLMVFSDDAHYAGWSDRVFDIMQKLDRDPEALVREVESVEICGADF